MSSCGSDDNSELLTLSQKDIVGVWESDNNEYSNDILEFLEDGTGIHKYGNKSPFKTEPFEWKYLNNVICIQFNDTKIEIPVSQGISWLSIIIDDVTYTKTIIAIDNSSGDNNTTTKYDKQLIGEWWNGDVLGKLKKRYFREDGTGFEVYSRNEDDYGLCYYYFNWNTETPGILTIKYDDESKASNKVYSVEDGNLFIGENKSDKWRNMGSDVKVEMKPNTKPFQNNYLHNKNTGYYYEISKVVKGCSHAGAGQNMNEKFIHFFGSDGTLTTTGLRIIYNTPSWEGIDSYWSSGTYRMSSSSGAYRYKAIAWCNGSSLSTYEGGTLKISTTSTTVIYEFKDDDLELYVVVSTKN